MTPFLVGSHAPAFIPFGHPLLLQLSKEVLLLLLLSVEDIEYEYEKGLLDGGYQARGSISLCGGNGGPHENRVVSWV